MGGGVKKRKTLYIASVLKQPRDERDWVPLDQLMGHLQAQQQETTNATNQQPPGLTTPTRTTRQTNNQPPQPQPQQPRQQQPQPQEGATENTNSLVATPVSRRARTDED